MRRRWWERALLAAPAAWLATLLPLAAAFGSEVRAKVLRPDHPIAYGYEGTPSVFRGNLPLFEIDRRYREWVVVQLGTKEVEDLDAREERLERQARGEEAAEPGREGEEAVGLGREGEEVESGDDDNDKGDKDFLLSGFVKDAKDMDGKPAILDVPVGRGRVLLYTFNPLHRYLNHSDFRFAFNAILHWDDLPHR